MRPVDNWIMFGVGILLVAISLLTGCASPYIAADKDMSRMSAAQLTRELSK